MAHSVHIKLIILAKLAILFLSYELLSFFTWNFLTESEVKVTLENAYIMISDLIVLVLSPSLPLEGILVNMSELLVASLQIDLTHTCLKMAVWEYKWGVLKLEPNAYSTFIARGVSKASLNFTTSYIKNARLDRFLGDQHNIEPKHVLLSANLILVRDSVLIEVFEN